MRHDSLVPEKTKKNLEVRLAKLNDAGKKDNAVTFEQQPERGDEQCEGTSGMVNLISASE